MNPALSLSRKRHVSGRYGPLQDAPSDATASLLGDLYPTLELDNRLPDMRPEAKVLRGPRKDRPVDSLSSNAKGQDGGPGKGRKPAARAGKGSRLAKLLGFAPTHSTSVLPHKDGDGDGEDELDGLVSDEEFGNEPKTSTGMTPTDGKERAAMARSFLTATRPSRPVSPAKPNGSLAGPFPK